MVSARAKTRWFGLLSGLFLVVFAAGLMAGGARKLGLEVSPDKAIKLLREGNDRFWKGTLLAPHSSAEWRRKLTLGQEPIATVISCSDSRVPPEAIFDVGFGDVFVIRTAGHAIAGEAVVGSIEYGVLHAHSKLIVVLGHQACGAVTAAIHNYSDQNTSIPELLTHIKPAADKARQTDARGDDQIAEGVQQNVKQSIKDILNKSPEIAQLVRDEKIKVVGAVYSLSTGKVLWMGEHPYQDEILSGK